MQRILLLVFAILLFFDAKGQEEESYPIDIGINVTSVLSSFIGNSNNLNASDFPLQFTFGRKPMKLRLGIGAASSNKSIFDQITLVNRSSKYTEVASRIGFLYDRPLGDRFGFYWGGDFIFQFSNNSVEAGSFGTFPSLEEKTIGGGAGPIFGLKFKLSKRIYLSTEATFYGLYSEETRTSSLDPTTVDTSFELMINPPLFLYLNISLGK